jgi:citrate lyase subunit beta/citryl-CoA lyase
MRKAMVQKIHRPRRTALYVPASNAKAMSKIASLDPDVVIFDLEDAVGPSEKAAAREALRAHFAAGRPEGGPERVIRINPLAEEGGTEDLLAAIACRPDAILLPKVESPRDVLDADDALDQADVGTDLRLWIMVETPRAMLNLGALAELGRDRAARLDCLIAGPNDLVKLTGILPTPDRRYLNPWLSQMVLAARAGGFSVLDGVSNDFRDLDAFSRECEEGAAMGFDGKTLIHPAQIEPARRAFSPSPEAIAEAKGIVAAFALPENAGKGVIAIDGKMVERLHFEQARALLAKAGTGASETSR